MPSSPKPERKASRAASAKTTTAAGRTRRVAPSTDDGAAPAQITAKIAALGDWRGAMLARVRALIHEADPEVVEEVKWGGVPVWSHDGILCTGETYKAVVKLTFAKGASVPDPSGLFNASLDGNTRRAIDLREGEPPDEQALIELVRAAVVVNQAGRR